MISIIAAIGKNNELGRDGDLIFRLPEDMRFFKKTTMWHKVVMGRRTWESLPGKLQGRENIVASRGEVSGVDLVVSCLPEFLAEMRDSEEEVFVIGGEAVYKAALPFAEKLYLTEVEAVAPDADVFFPKFDRSKYQRRILAEDSESSPKYTICCYTRVKDKEAK